MRSEEADLLTFHCSLFTLHSPLHAAIASLIEDQPLGADALLREDDTYGAAFTASAAVAAPHAAAATGPAATTGPAGSPATAGSTASSSATATAGSSATRAAHGQGHGACGNEPKHECDRGRSEVSTVGMQAPHEVLPISWMGMNTRGESFIRVPGMGFIGSPSFELALLQGSWRSPGLEFAASLSRKLLTRP